MSKASKHRRRLMHSAIAPRAIAEAVADVTKPTHSAVPMVSTDGHTLSVPLHAELPEVISMLESIQADRERDAEQTQITVSIPVLPYEGALALTKALKQHFGMLIQQHDQWGRRLQYEVEVAYGETVRVPWGVFELPGMGGGYVTTSTDISDGRHVFQCVFHCRRQYENDVKRVMDLTREIATRESIYRGRAFSMIFRNESGRRIDMLEPRFFPLVGEEPIFNDDTAVSIERNVIMPILYAKELAAKGQSLKRGVLFAGKYGVGKSLLASHIAQMAVAAGWTFIYVKNAGDLPDALRFAQLYQPVVLFVEDIDRVAGIERTDKVDELMKQLDGIDGKKVQILTILTTNHPEKINPGMLRPGRIDLRVIIGAPNAKTTERILRQFGGERLAPGTALTEPAALLAGESPARIREALQRSVLEALRRSGSVDSLLTGEDILAIAHEMKNERTLLTPEASVSPLPQHTNGAAI